MPGLFFEALCADYLDIGRSGEMQIIFGRRVRTPPEGGYRTRLLRSGDEVTLNAYFRHSRVKSSLKCGRALRIETVVNDTADLGLLRGLTHLEELSVKARDVNRRMVNALRVGQSCVLASPAFERVARPTLEDGRRVPALRFGDPRVMALASALCAVVHTITGFTNRSLRAQVNTLLGTPYSQAQMSYDLRRLRLKGLITRLPHSNSYVPAGQSRPWTDDPILQTYKFCNVYRAADRVSQYMISEVCYHDEPCTPEDRLFQIVAFRAFSKIETWQSVRDFFGRYPTLGDLGDGSFTKVLDHAKQKNNRRYTGAFILYAADAYGQSCKHLNHVELFRHMFLRDDLGKRLLEAKLLREVYELLHEYPLMGDFMSYQTAIDLNYSGLIDFSENEFARPGPGALCGIRKCFENLGGYASTEVIMWMVEYREREFARFGLSFNGPWGRLLRVIDCQGLFCETDKYCREAAPELASTRKRIKALFSVTSEPIQLLFPLKWRINDKPPKGAVLGEAPTSINSAQNSLL